MSENITPLTPTPGDSPRQLLEKILIVLKSGGVGASKFTSLTDVPNSYVGASNKFVTVNVGETGLVFTASTPGGVASVTASAPLASSGGVNPDISITSGLFANPTQSIDLSTHNGVLTTAMRSDAAPAINQTIAPTWTSLHTFRQDALGTTPSDGILLENTTVASAPQYAPRLHFQGRCTLAGGAALHGYIDLHPETPSLSISTQVGLTGVFRIADFMSSNAADCRIYLIGANSAYYIDGVSVLSKTGLGNTVLSSSLTSVGTISTGIWNGTAVDATHGGTNQSTWTLGDTLYSDAANSLAKLSGNTTAVQKFLSQTGTGAVSAAPSWQPISSTGALLYYLTNTASAVATYLQQLTAPYTPKTTIPFAALGAGNTTLKNWITQPGFPGLTFIPAGQFEFHIHASQTAGTKTAVVFAEIWEANAAGVDIAKIGTTEVSTALTGAETEYRLFFSTANTYNLASSASRIVTRVIATVSGGGSAPTVNLIVGDEADSHITLPTNTVDATNFVPYTGATTDVDLGTHFVNAHTFKIGGSVPGATELMGYDITDAASKFISIGTGLSYDHATHTLSSTGGGVTPAALTKTDDTNVTLTLGGTPATALLQATSLTLGWTGQLALGRGGTGANLSAPAADKLWGWDNTDTAIGFWTIGDVSARLKYTHASHTLDVNTTLSGMAVVSGGGLTVQGTDRTSSGSPGENINLRGGNAFTGGSDAGGDVNINGGTSTGNAKGGGVNITGGAATESGGNGGDLNLDGGTTVDASVGSVFLCGFQGKLSVFNATPAAQQTMGAATAGGSYGATEQTMLQKCYDVLRTFGFGT